MIISKKNSKKTDSNISINIRTNRSDSSSLETISSENSPNSFNQKVDTK